MKRVLKRSLSAFLTGMIILNTAFTGLGEVVFSRVFAVETNAVSHDDLIFELNDDGKSYSVIDCDTSAQGELIIPGTYNGLPVTGIGDYAFADCTGLTSVTLPDTAPESNSSTKIVNDCQNTSDWTTHTSSECEEDKDDYAMGTQSIHSDGGAMICTYDTYDMLNNNLVLKLRINNIAGGARLYMQVLSTSNPYATVVYNLMRGTSTTPVGEWREITVPYTGYAWESKTGAFSEIDFTAIDYLRIYAVGEVDWNLQYVGLRHVTSKKGIVTFTFDDGYASQYTGLKILAEKGITGTLFYIPEANTNGSDEFLKVTDLKELVNVYGADIEVHGASSYNNMTNEELIKHWKSTQQFLKENNLSDGKHMAYPNGMHEDRVVQLAKNYFDSCRTIQYYIPCEAYPPADNYRIRAISSIGSSGNDVDYIKDKIDKAMMSKSWLVLVFHKIGDVTGDTMYCSADDLREIADYAVSSGADIMNMAEVMDSVKNIEPSGVISVGKYAFSSCSNLESIAIPDSVKNIDEKAFGYSNNNGTYQKIDGFTIYASKWSVAQNYANENGFDFVDVNHTHTVSDWITDKKASVYKPGAKHKECTRCGEVLKTDKIQQLKCSKPELRTISNIQSGVKITWGKVTGADYYRVYRKTGSGKWHQIAKHIKTRYYTDKTAKSGTSYKYTVRAQNEVGLSGYNNTGLSTRYLADPILKTPTSTKSGITLKWSKVTGAQGYVIYRKTGNGSYTKLKTEKGVSNLSYVDKSARKGKKYTYKVKAYYGKIYSAYSTTKTIKGKY